MATRNDVAKLAGVSTATISYYINKSGYVSAQTGEKIANAIKELDYRPNLIAKSLKLKDSKQFVFVCNEIRNPFHAQIASRVANIAHENNYLTLICNSIGDDNYIKNITMYQVSGIFVATRNIDTTTVDMLSDSNLNVVILDDCNVGSCGSNISRIILDFTEVIEQLVQHVIDNGATDLCLVSAFNCDELDICRDGKVTAFQKSMDAHASSISSYRIVGNIAIAKESYEFILKEYKDKDKKNIPNCFICGNDSVAQGIIRALHELGLEVPRDVLITGFDNTDSAKMSIPSLTSIDISLDDISRIAMEMLLNKQQTEQVTDVTLPAKLIMRESTSRK